MLMSVSISCVKDLGNYETNVLPDFEVEGINDKYYVTSYLENLKIEPKFTTDDNSNDFSCIWTVLRTIKQEGTASNITVSDTISKENILDVPFEYKTGSYKLQLKAINNNTGLAKFYTAEITAVSPYTIGTYVLKETSDGKTDMDIHFSDKDPVVDVVKLEKGASLESTPKSLSYLPYVSFLDEQTGEIVVSSLMIPASEKNMVTFDMEDMKPKREYEQWFYGAAADFDDLICFYPGGFYLGLCTKTGVFTNYQCPGSPWGAILSAGKFGEEPVLAPDNQPYSITENVVFDNSSTLFFDKGRGAFMGVTMNMYIKELSISEEGINPGKIEDELIYLGLSKVADADNAFALFRRSDGSMYYYFFSFVISDYGSSTIKFTQKIEANENIKDADIYAVTARGASYLYSVKGTDIYALSSDGKTEKKIVLQDLPAGEITYFNTMYCDFGEEGDGKYNQMIVATYNNGKYTVSLYDLISGEPVRGKGPAAQYSGDGKVCSIQIANSYKKLGDPGWSANF